MRVVQKFTFWEREKEGGGVVVGDTQSVKKHIKTQFDAEGKFILQENKTKNTTIDRAEDTAQKNLKKHKSTMNTWYMQCRRETCERDK